MRDLRLTTAGKSTRIIGVIGSVRGLSAVEAIAACSERLCGLLFGAANMPWDIGCDASWDPLVFPRGRLYAACAGAGVVAIDGPFSDVLNRAGCQTEAVRGAFGFGAKAAIHPVQVRPIQAALTPSELAVREAMAYLARNGEGTESCVKDARAARAARAARTARKILAAAGH